MRLSVFHNVSNFICEAYFANLARIYFIEKTSFKERGFFMAEKKGFEPLIPL